jgi:hypothetical protein
VELFEQIRRDGRLEQLSIRELAERHKVHRRTVRQALDCAVPPPHKEYAQRRYEIGRASRLGSVRTCYAAYGSVYRM